jgi:hypothetical protein
VTTASAAPLNSAATATEQLTRSSAELAQYKPGLKQQRRAHRRWHRNRARNYRHWRRYHARPSNWEARGCIVVGPIWYCP